MKPACDIRKRLQTGLAGRRTERTCSGCAGTRFFYLASQLYRGQRIPEPGGFVPACRQDPGAVRTKCRVLDSILMVKGGDQLTRVRIPELGGLVRACRQDARAVRTK